MSAIWAGALTGKDSMAIIDLRGVTYNISLLAIRLIVSTIKQFRQRGIEFVTIRPRDNLANEALVVANFLDHLNMVEDEEAASAVLNTPS